MTKHHTKEDKLDNTQLARRRLLKAGVYMPPAILGVMLASPKNAEAVTVDCGGGVLITISAWSTACCPCASSINSAACKSAQCLLGNCAKCAPNTKYATKQECVQYQDSPCAAGCKCVNIVKGKNNYWQCQ